MGKHHARFYRMERVIQDKRQEKNYPNQLNKIEANIRKSMCRKSDSEDGMIESSEKVAAMSL